MFTPCPVSRAVLIVSCCLLPAAAFSGTEPLPKVFYADPRALAEAKAKFKAHDPSLQPAFDQLLAEAREAVRAKPPSVMNKQRVPPSGDKHDYVSQAPYFWRDTNSPDGRYIRRDGERNPEAGRDSDAGPFATVCSNVHTLALAFYFTGDEAYAAHAAKTARVWFLDPATRMNPHLNFGQGIPGQTDGRAAGVIGTRGVVPLVDGLALLAGSKAWSAEDQKGMVDWMTKYLDWLRTSEIGIAEGNASNNHGTIYDSQVAALALFAGQTDLARQVIAGAREKRIAKQIEPDGKQPRELQRTKSFGYSLFNIRGLLDLAAMGDNLGMDLWSFQTADGRSIRKALEFVAPYADPNKPWPYQQIEKTHHSFTALLLRAAPHYPGSGFENALKFFPADELASSRDRLLFRTASLPSEKAK